MSKFLRVGLIADTINDIIEASSLLMDKTDKDEPGTRQIARDIHDMATNLLEFMSRLSSEPIIYTGEGSTDQVIDMLERLLKQTETAGASGAPGASEASE